MLLSPKQRAGKATGFQHAETCDICIKADHKSECNFCSEMEQIKKKVQD